MQNSYNSSAKVIGRNDPNLIEEIRVCRCLFLLVGLSLTSLPAQAKENIKLSFGQYRIFDGADSYGLTPLSVKYSTSRYKTRLMLPYIRRDSGQSGLGNMSVKLSYLTQWQRVFVDFHYRQKLATADEQLTLPVRDKGMSIELSSFLSGGIGFVELGHTWRKSEHKTHTKRNDGFYYALGGMYPMKKGFAVGCVFDYKTTALGRLDHSATGLMQYKLDSTTLISASLGRGLTDTSPAWLAGLTWSKKY